MPTCEHPGCQAVACGFSILGRYCAEHAPSPDQILRADTFWRDVWWNALSVEDQRGLLEGRADALGEIVARTGLMPPTRVQIWAVARGQSD